MRRTDQKPTLIVKKNPWLPVELYRYMRALVQKRTHSPCMANGECLQGRMITLLEGKANPRTAFKQIGGGADPMRGGTIGRAFGWGHDRLIVGSFVPNRLNSARRRSGTLSTNISEGSRNSCDRSWAP